MRKLITVAAAVFTGVTLFATPAMADRGSVTDQSRQPQWKAPEQGQRGADNNRRPHGHGNNEGGNWNTDGRGDDRRDNGDWNGRDDDRRTRWIDLQASLRGRNEEPGPGDSNGRGFAE